MSCPCLPAAEQPWQARGEWYTKASFVGGIVILAFGVVALVAGLHPWVGWLVLGLLGASGAVAAALEARRGHRGWCLARRAVWFGLAVPGVPVRILPFLP